MNIYKIGIVLVSACVITGCSNTSTQSEYNEIELIEYKACIDFYMSGMSKFGGSYILSDQYIEQAKETCTKVLPVRK